MSDMYDIRDKMYRLIKLGYPLAAIILAVDGVDRNIEYCDLLERVIDIYERRFKPNSNRELFKRRHIFAALHAHPGLPHKSWEKAAHALLDVG